MFFFFFLNDIFVATTVFERRQNCGRKSKEHPGMELGWMQKTDYDSSTLSRQFCGVVLGRNSLNMVIGKLGAAAPSLKTNTE